MNDSTTSSENMPARRSGGGTGLLRLGVAAVVVVALVFVGREAGGYVEGFARWVDGLGIWAPVVYALGYAVATVAFVPGSILTLAAGALFGLWKGTLVVIAGASVGAVLAFLVGRYGARGAVEKKISGSDKFAAIDRAVGRQGMKIVFLLRLSPVFPFNLLNYALGLTSVRLWDYTVACLGMLPGTFLYVYLGKAAGDLASVLADSGGAPADEAGAGRWVVLGIGLAATVAVTLVVTRIARRALTEHVGDEVVEDAPGDDAADDEENR